MKRVSQIGPDDCFRACIASLLELRARDVPNYYRSGDNVENDMYAKMQRWLSRRYALSLVTVIRPPDKSVPDWLSYAAVPTRFIATVPVYGGWHAVVAGLYGERLRLVHDPGRQTRISLRHLNCATFLISPESLPRSAS